MNYGDRELESFQTKVAHYQEFNKPHLLNVKYGFHYTVGNREPYFFITATIWEKLGNGRWHNIGGGCCHELIAKVCPQLKPLIPYHLFDQSGVPMHYVDNGKYWGALTLGISEWQNSNKPPHGKTFRDVLKEHCLVDEVGDEKRMEYELMRWAASRENAPVSAKKGFAGWLESRMPALRKIFDETMDRFNVKRIEAVCETQS